MGQRAALIALAAATVVGVLGCGGETHAHNAAVRSLDCTGACGGVTHPGFQNHPVVATIPSDLPRLRSAVALGTLVALDGQRSVAEFRISCGWHATKGGRATSKLRPGLFRVPLRGFGFNVETYPAGPASGVANEVSLSTWERWASRSGWTGQLYVYPGLTRPWLTDGPTTDICHGVLG
jgi:hypothetical protein